MYRYVPYVGTHIPENLSPIQVVFEEGVAGRGGAYGYIYVCTYVYPPTLMMRKIKEMKESKRKDCGWLARGFFFLLIF